MNLNHKMPQKYIYYVVITAAALIFIYFLYISSVVTLLSQFQPAATIKFLDNKWINVDHAVIYNKYSIGDIFPDNNLILSLTITNKLNTPTGIEPKIYTSTGGIVIKTKEDYGMYIIVGGKTDTKFYDFYAGKEGQNEIKIAVQVTNFTGHIPYGYVNSSAFIDVLSSSKLQQQSNSYTFYGLIFSGVIGVLTVIALYLTLSSSRHHVAELKDQNKILEEETKMLREQSSEQIRPWISISQKEVAPSEYFSHTIIVPQEIVIEATKSMNVHLGFHISYKFEKTKDGNCIIIGYWNFANNKFMYKIKKLT